MSIGFEKICSNLQVYNKEITISNKSGPEIKDIVYLENDALLKNCGQDYKNTILYLIKASDILNSEPVNLPDNILCLYDIDINTKIIFPETSNIILIKDVTDITELYNIIEKQITDNNRITRSSARILELATKNSGIQYIAENCFDIFGNPMIVTDRTLGILAYSRIAINQPLWNEIVAKGHGSYEIIREFKKAHKKEKCIMAYIENSKYRHMTTSIISHGNIAGYISLFDYLKPFDDIDEELLFLLGKIVASEMEKDIHYSRTREMMFEYFIQDLIEGKIKNETIIQDKLNYMGLNLKKYLFLLKIGFKPGDRDEDNLWYIKEKLESATGFGNSLIYGKGILFIISSDIEPALSDKETQILCGFLKENKMIGGFSRYFFDITRIKDNYEQCTKAMEIGCHLNGNKNLFMYDDYYVYHVIETLNAGVNIRSICHPALMELIEYDKNNNTEYCKTLYVYLSSSSNLTKSAKYLSIHRNTMEYRINKIEEILKMKIHDSNNPLVLYLSLSIVKYMSKQGSFKLGYIF